MKKIIPILLCILLFTSCGQKTIVVPPVKQGQPQTEVQQSAPAQTEIVKEEVPKQEKLPAVEQVADPQPTKTESVTLKVFGLEGEEIFSAQAPYREDFSVFDLLTESAREKNIPVVYSGGKSSPYVTSINGLSEKQKGPNSGWTYKLNGKTVMVACNKCILSPGDVAQWIYITDFTSFE